MRKTLKTLEEIKDLGWRWPRGGDWLSRDASIIVAESMLAFLGTEIDVKPNEGRFAMDGTFSGEVWTWHSSWFVDDVPTTDPFEAYLNENHPEILVMQQWVEWDSLYLAYLAGKEAA